MRTADPVEFPSARGHDSAQWLSVSASFQDQNSKLRAMRIEDALDKIRWVVEAALSWFNNHRRLRMCSEKTGAHFLAFHQLAAAMIYFNKLGNGAST